MKGLFAKFISIMLALLTLAAVLPLAVAAENDGISAPNSGSAEVSEDVMYLDYIASYEDAEYPAARVDIALGEPVTLGEGESLSSQVEIQQEGLYVLELSYKTEGSSSATVALYINGKTPFEEAALVDLKNKFYDVEDISDKNLTSDTIPDVVAADEYQTIILTDTIGYYGGRLYFYMPAGANELRVDCVENSVSISSLAFTYYDAPAKYDAEAVKKSGKVYDGDTVYFEAEYAEGRSDASIYATNDNSGAALSPSSPYKKYLNMIGGTAWQEPGQYIEWEFEVPKTALYEITVKYRQSDSAGLNSYRRILIDGKVPYAELEEYSFGYSSIYKNETLSANGEPMLFSLDEGKHTLRMEVVGGELAEILPYVENVVASLNDDYRNIIMVTGSDADTLRDYLLDSVIPDTIADLKKQQETLAMLVERLQKTTSGGSEGTKIMGTLSEQLKVFLEDTYNITQNLPKFKSNITALSTWLISARYQPLRIDLFALSENEDAVKSAKASLWKNFTHQFLGFLYTFSSDYADNAINSDEEDVITVWLRDGAVKYTIASQLVRSEFEKQHPDIKVNFKMVNNNLLTAVVSGKQPDVAIGVTNDLVMNYAFRNAVIDLNQFPDSKEVFSKFRPSALVSMTYEDKIYGMPEAQSFNLLYYRKDILDELDISVPTTWNEMITAMAKLKKNNLEVGMGGSSFTQLLYQYGGQLYNDECSATQLDTYEAIEAFALHTSFYTEYGALLSYDADNRFRTGEMPIVLGAVTFYNTISVLAPEIRGLWGVAEMPGVLREDGTIDNRVTTDVSAMLILKEDKKEASWEFLKWWMSESVQTKYIQKIETILGQSARVASANPETFLALDWSSEMRAVLDEVDNDLIGIPAVPGSYYTSRHLGNAFSRVVYDDEIPGDALDAYVDIIDAEIAKKRKQLGLTD